MPTATLTTISTSRSVRLAGFWCLAAGMLGAAQAAIVLAWSPQVPAGRFSYPFTGAGLALAQVSFFLQHLPLIAGVAALLLLPAVGASRAARIGTRTAVVGLLALAMNELVTITAYDAATDSHHATLVESLYGPPVLLIGIGLVIAGAALLRQGTAAWPGARWMPAVVLLTGVYVFVPLTPAIMGSFTSGRLGIGGWMLLFVVLGYGLIRLTDEAAVGIAPGTSAAR